jgi:thiamine biosynthesis protein ThiC
MGSFQDTLIEQAEQGVSYFTIHAGFVEIHSSDSQQSNRNCIQRRLYYGKMVPLSS